MLTKTTPPTCRRCGQCCLAGGPALHRCDLPLLNQGIIVRGQLVTLRAGETVHENVAGGLTELDDELVKIAGIEGRFACLFYNEALKTCRIHADRPEECRVLFCEDPAPLKVVYVRNRLSRANILDTRGALWELVQFHDRTFPAATAMRLAREASKGRKAAGESLAEITRAEENFRKAFLEKTGAPQAALDFYFGRSLVRICAPFGVRFGF